MKCFIIITMLFMTCALVAQVGINREIPKHALDVNGKVRIADDNDEPNEGAIRYGANGDFEGYTSSGWTSLTNNSSPLPTNPVPITSFSPNIAPGATQYCIFYNWEGTAYTVVPDEKRFIVTGIYPTANASTAVNHYYSLEIGAFTETTFVNHSRIRINSYDNESRYLTGDPSPLVVLNEGQRLGIFSFGSSEITMNVSVRGFMVDNLNYD